LEQLAQACEPASFGLKQECVLDETYRKAGKMDSDYFSSKLDLSHTDLMDIIRGYLLEGTQSTNKAIQAKCLQYASIPLLPPSLLGTTLLHAAIKILACL
jgi:hypothetical protein